MVNVVLVFVFSFLRNGALWISILRVYSTVMSELSSFLGFSSYVFSFRFSKDLGPSTRNKQDFFF